MLDLDVINLTINCHKFQNQLIVAQWLRRKGIKKPQLTEIAIVEVCYCGAYRSITTQFRVNPQVLLNMIYRSKI